VWEGRLRAVPYLGHDQSSTLLYGNARLPTLSLALALPDGCAVDLGQAPVTDQQGVAGLTGRVNQHYWHLFGAVFIGGAVRGGLQALQLAMAGAAGAGQVAAGIATTVERELYDYLQCGILAHGFLRLGCETCTKSCCWPSAVNDTGFAPPVPVGAWPRPQPTWRLPREGLS
jgi:hypothetical protein